MRTYRRGERHGARDETARLGVARRHHTELALVDELFQILDLVAEWHVVLEVGGLVWVRGLVAGRSVGV